MDESIPCLISTIRSIELANARLIPPIVLRLIQILWAAKLGTFAGKEFIGCIIESSFAFETRTNNQDRKLLGNSLHFIRSLLPYS